MKVKTHSLIFLIPLIVCTQCGLFKKKKEKSNEKANQPLARVYNNYLYKESIVDLFPKNTTQKDSIDILNRYITNWVKQQLLLEEAEKKTNYNHAELERKIMEYRYALLVYEFEKKYIAQHLDTMIQDNEIKKYYDTHLGNFELKQNIVKANLIKISKELNNRLKQIRKLIKSTDKKDQKELQSLCFRFAESYTIESNLWFDFDELATHTPFATIPNKIYFLKNTTYTEVTEGKFIYILYIHEYKIADQRPPLGFVRKQIINILLNERKLELGKQLEKEIMNKAIQQKNIEIYP